MVNPDIQPTEIADVFAAVSGTLLGFIVAALSILGALTNRTLLENMRKTGHFTVLLDELYFSAAAYLSVVVVMLSLFFVPTTWACWFVVVGAGLMVFATLLFISAGHKFYLVLSTVH